MKEIKNFLEEKDFLELENLMCKSWFPWYKNNSVVKKGDGHTQFTHTFYLNSLVKSDFFSTLNPLINKLKPEFLIKIKANLLLKNDKIIEHGMHVDMHNSKFCKYATTSILYLNTNNGHTVIKTGNKKIKSERNKLVTFKASEEHTGTTCTDEEYRIILNLNYLK